MKFGLLSSEWIVGKHEVTKKQCNFSMAGDTSGTLNLEV